MKKFDKDKYLRKLKLKRLWSKYQRYIYLGILCLTAVFIGIYFTHSKFTTAIEEEVIRTTVGNFIYGDVIATPYIDGEYSLTFPEKKTGINVEKIVCDNDTSASWDEEKWGLMVTNLSKRTKCNIYFVTPASCGINDNVSCVSSREELATLATEVNNGDNNSGKIIYLTSDLDLGGKFDSEGNALDGNISWTPIGTYDTPFSGTFDGNGHIIKNMYVNEKNDASLFLVVTNSTIKNFGILSSYVKSEDGKAASLAAEANNVIIKNFFSLATIKGQKSSAGIIGVGTGTILNSYNGGTVDAGSNQFGAGIVGYLVSTYSSIINSYNYGNVIGGYQGAGIVGGLQGTVDKCYNLGNVGFNNDCGGIVGQLFDPESPRVYNSYNSGSVSGGGIINYIQENNGNYKLSDNYYLDTSASWGVLTYPNNVGAEPLTKDQMPSVISVINGDNAFVEDTNNINNGYPILKWQAERENN